MGLKNGRRFTSSGGEEKKRTHERFHFETMKSGAINADPTLRKKAFIEYFECFEEFPSYLFDNEIRIDPMLQQTIDDLLKDPDITKELRTGVESLLRRLPS